ncbi:MAG TPA: EI24 domain-containing protein [Caldimonas sp.]|nr:EI24 domain-containing protein [Caldimonas sp.]HEX2542607.1 EI24 domain-containing protein [Caldimonas sp.]
MSSPRGVRDILDAFWRAAAYCLHPKVILLSVAPLVVVGGGAAALGYYLWEPAVGALRESLESWSLLGSLFAWLESVGLGGFRSVLAPLLIVALAVPVFIVVTLFVVALLMTPAIVRLVAARRFPTLVRARGAGFLHGLAWSLGCTLVALAALIVSIPLWFVPPLVLILPPLIWGWLTYRVLAFDVLVEFASGSERVRLLHERRWPLLGMGVAAGALGAAPSLLWAVSALALVLAPLLILISIWLYTLVFAFSSLWFAHYLLTALERLRAEEASTALAATPATAAVVPPALGAPSLSPNGLPP